MCCYLEKSWKSYLVWKIGLRIERLDKFFTQFTGGPRHIHRDPALVGTVKPYIALLCLILGQNLKQGNLAESFSLRAYELKACQLKPDVIFNIFQPSTYIAAGHRTDLPKGTTHLWGIEMRTIRCDWSLPQ